MFSWHRQVPRSQNSGNSWRPELSGAGSTPDPSRAQLEQTLSDVLEVRGEGGEALKPGFGFRDPLHGGGEGAGPVESEMERGRLAEFFGSGDGLGVEAQGFVELPEVLPAFAELEEDAGTERVLCRDLFQALDSPAVVAGPLEADGDFQLEPGILREPLAPGVQRGQFQPAEFLIPAAKRLLVGGRWLVLDETAGDGDVVLKANQCDLFYLFPDGKIPSGERHCFRRGCFRFVEPRKLCEAVGKRKIVVRRS